MSLSERTRQALRRAAEASERRKQEHAREEVSKEARERNGLPPSIPKKPSSKPAMPKKPVASVRKVKPRSPRAGQEQKAASSSSSVFRVVICDDCGTEGTQEGVQCSICGGNVIGMDVAMGGSEAAEQVAAAGQQETHAESEPPAPEPEPESAAELEAAVAELEEAVGEPESDGHEPSKAEADSPAQEEQPAVDAAAEEEEKNETDSSAGAAEIESAYQVGQEVMAQWVEDELWYRAEVLGVSADASSFHVRFIEYGNEQENTPLQGMAALPPAEEEPEVEESAEPEPEPEPELETEPEEPVKAKPDAEWAMSDVTPGQEDSTNAGASPSSSSKKGSKSTGKIIGRNNDGTPIYMTKEDEERLKAEKRLEKKMKMKGAMAKLKFGKKDDKKDDDGEEGKKKRSFLGKSPRRHKEKEPEMSIGSPMDVKKVNAGPGGPPSGSSPVTAIPSSSSASPKKPPPVPLPPGGGKKRPGPPPIPSSKPLVSPRGVPVVKREPQQQEEAAVVVQQVSVEKELDLVQLPPVAEVVNPEDFTAHGHLFITLGDLRKVSCDAWLVPVGWDYVPHKKWFLKANAKARNYAGAGSSGLRYFGSQTRVKRAPGWPAGRPAPYLGNTSRDAAQEHQLDTWLYATVQQFLEVASQELVGTPPQHGRLKHLIALPLVGANYGGKGSLSCVMVRQLLPLLIEHAKLRNVDVLLVTNQQAHYAALQAERAKLPESFATLPASLKAKADEIARYARLGRLSLFLGRGLSEGAGLPTFQQLMGELAVKANASEPERDLLAKMSVMDQANILQSRLGGAEKLAKLIAARLTSSNYSLSHSLLSCLNATCVVTTNRDTLFETASRDAGATCAVLPYQPSRDGGRFVFKMHGCITEPNDIVLTREDYTRYAEMRSALSGIVQSTLVASHMLFVGFSLTDDNFLKITDSVRLALANAPSVARKQATAMLLCHSDLSKELWADLDAVSMLDKGAQVPLAQDLQQAGNLLEIFLDFVLARSVSATKFIMHPHHSDLLDDKEKAFRDHLNKMLEEFPEGAKSTPAYAALQSALKEQFGASSNSE